MHFMQASLLAQTVTPPTTNWLNVFTNNITNLTTQDGDVLSQMGMLLMSFIAFFKFVEFGIRVAAHRATYYDFQVLLFRLLLCLAMEYYWVNSLPGVNYGLNRLFSSWAMEIAKVLDQKSLDKLTAAINTAAHSAPMPSATALSQIACYWIVQLLMGFAAAIIFLVNCSAFIFYGVTALFGPLMIPLYMTEQFRGKYLHFLEVLCSYAMIRAVGSAFIFVWSGFLVTFLNQTFQGDYSLAMWSANFTPIVMVFLSFIFSMLLVPVITQQFLGGGAAAAGKMGELAERAAVYSMTK